MGEMLRVEGDYLRARYAGEGIAPGPRSKHFHVYAAMRRAPACRRPTWRHAAGAAVEQKAAIVTSRYTTSADAAFTWFSTSVWKAFAKGALRAT
jgi:hypothetical protein